MTYNVFGGTLNLAQSINQASYGVIKNDDNLMCCHRHWSRPSVRQSRRWRKFRRQPLSTKHARLTGLCLSLCASLCLSMCAPNFHAEGDVPHWSFVHGWLGQWMPYNFVADSFHTKKLCSRLSSSQVRFYTENGRFAFLRGLRGNIRWSSQAHWKRVVDFLLVLIELFR